MPCNYRLLRNGDPVAWFIHAEQVETILHNDPNPAWSVEFVSLSAPHPPLPMELSESGWLKLTDQSNAYVEAL